jgi:hypothetical protein
MLPVSAQKMEFSGYDWNTFPPAVVSDTIKPINGATIALERRINEVYLNKEDVFEELSIFHRRIKVSTHDAINNFNKFYIPVNNVIEVVGIKARFISPSGKITEVPGESIKEVENLENKGNFRVFAIEGAESGGEIEYYYKLRKKFSAYGSVVTQGNEPRSNVETIFAFPSKLAFFVKSYNGFPEFIASFDTASQKKYLRVSTAYIAGIAEERYAAYEDKVMRYEYTLTHNNYTSSLRIYSFSKVANNIYNNLYVVSKADNAALTNALKKIKVEELPEIEKIRKLERWLKSDMLISEDLPAAMSMDEMLRLKQATEFGITRLFVAFLNKLNIPFETVITSNQAEKKFDPDFNGWNFLNDYLLYFPEFDAVILPGNSSYRLGMIPANYQGTYGLFLHPLSYGKEQKTLAYDIKKLPADHYLNNSDSLFIHVRLNPDQMNLDAEISRVFTGEFASSFQSFWKLINAERQDEIVRGMFNMGSENTTIHSYALKNETPDDIAVKPLIWDVNLTANALVEQAGDDIIIKIGETIGEQSELYQQTARKLPVYVGNLHGYYRRIEFDIPDGYTILNVEDLKMKVEMVYDNKVSCCFLADYELLANKLIVHSTEYYSQLEYPLEEFESFRKVINAAADFNKKTILLKKEQ